MAEPILDQACLRLCEQLNQTLLTEHTKKMGSLTQCLITFVNSPQILSKLCVYTDYIIGCYISLRKVCCYRNKLATIFEKRTLTAST